MTKFVAICPLTDHFLPTFWEARNVEISTFSGIFGQKPTFFSINRKGENSKYIY